MIKSYEEAQALFDQAKAQGRDMGNEINSVVRFELGMKMIELGRLNGDPQFEQAGWNTIEDIIKNLKSKEAAE